MTSDCDISYDNSTDDPDYKCEEDTGVSSSSSSSEDFVNPVKPGKQKRKTVPVQKMSADTVSGDCSSQACFNLSQVVEEVEVVFLTSFNESKPGRFVFVTGDGKMTRMKSQALTHSNGFVLVFSCTKDWTDFCKESVDMSVSHKYVFEEHSVIDAMDQASSERFNVLLWVNPGAVSQEVDLDPWYKLLEDYSGMGLNHILLQSIDAKTQQSNRAGDMSAQAENVEGPLTTQIKPKSQKFNFKRLSEDTSEFIERNMSPNTQKATKQATDLFNKFMKEVHPELLHCTLGTVEEFRLPKLLSEMFKSLQIDEKQAYNASSLQSHYHGICRFLKIRRKILVKGNPQYEECRDVLHRQQKISCEAGQRPGLHRSHAYPPHILAEAWAKKAFGPSDPRALVAALLLHMGTTFGIRGKQELSEILNEDLILGPRRPDGVLSFIRYNERKTKTRTGLDGQGARKIENMLTPDDKRPERCPCRLFDLFQSKKPKEKCGPEDKFFLGCKNISTKDWSQVSVWYIQGHMGVTILSKIVVTQIASKGISTEGLKLTGVSTRKTGLDGALSSGMPSTYVACMAGQKSLASQTSYVSPTDATLRATNTIMQNVISGEASSGRDFNEVFKEEKAKEAKMISAIKNSEGLEAMNEDDAVTEDVKVPEPEPKAAETFDEPKLKSKRTKKKSMSKKRRKHRHRSPSTSSSSSSSSSECSSSSSSSEDEKKKVKKMKKKMKRKMKRKMRRMKENIRPQPMMMPMMMPMSYQPPYPGMNNNFTAPPPHFHNFSVPQPSGSGQVLSQITATVAKSANTNRNSSLVRDDMFN